MVANLVIPLPQNLGHEDIFQFSREIDSFDEDVNRVVFDMGEQRWFPPFSMTFLSAKLKQLIRANPHIKFSVRNYENHPYPAHMGFFKAFDLDFGKNIGQAFGSKQYLPITSLSRPQLLTKPTDIYEEAGDLIQNAADRIATLISRDIEGKSDFFKTMSYSIREIFRNTFEHAECENVYYCAQYWPSQLKVEVSIVDHGI